VNTNSGSKRGGPDLEKQKSVLQRIFSLVEREQPSFFLYRLKKDKRGATSAATTSNLDGCTESVAKEKEENTLMNAADRRDSSAKCKRPG